MKKLFYVGALSALLLVACNGEGATNEAEKDEVVETEVEQAETTTDTEPVTEITWNEKISEFATGEGVASDKFYALEKFMIEYEASPEEVERFKNEIIEDYKSGAYLSELDNHERMLTNIFKSYIVEQNSDEDAVKNFAFDYHQNLKYTYRGADTVDSEAVKSNEHQMNKALAEIQ